MSKIMSSLCLKYSNILDEEKKNGEKAGKRHFKWSKEWEKK